MRPEGHRTEPILSPTEDAGVLYSPVHVPLMDALGNQQGAEFVHAVTDHTPGQGAGWRKMGIGFSVILGRSGLLLRPGGLCLLLRDTQAST